MNIVYLVYELINSGPENVLYDICANLDRQKFHPIIVTLRSEIGERSTEGKFKDLGIEIRHLSFSTIQLELRTKWVARTIEDSLNDVGDFVIHAHGHHPSLIASYFKHPSMCTIHCISGEDYVIKKGKLLGGYMSWRFKNRLSKIQRPVAISDYMRDYYKNYAKDTIATIYNGVTVKPSLEERGAIRRKLNLEESSYVIVVIGSVIPRKNTLYIIEQLKQLKDDGIMCLIIGNGSDLDASKQMAAGDYRFRFEGFKNDVSDYLYSADISISASRSEGLPLSVLEALNAGIPMLMSDIPPHKEIETAMDMACVRTFSLTNNGLLPAFVKMKEQRFDKVLLQKKACELFSAETMVHEYEKLYAAL